MKILLQQNSMRKEKKKKNIGAVKTFISEATKFFHKSHFNAVVN